LLNNNTVKIRFINFKVLKNITLGIKEVLFLKKKRMDEESIKKYVGKKVLIILKNSYQYTCIIPEFSGKSFSVIDKFGERLDVSCDFINFIKEVPEQ
jgi:ribosomal protein L21E